MEKMVAGDDGWTDWIHPLPGYLMQCCGCGFIHEMQVAITPSRANTNISNYGEDALHVAVFRMRAPLEEIHDDS